MIANALELTVICLLINIFCLKYCKLPLLVNIMFILLMPFNFLWILTEFSEYTMFAVFYAFFTLYINIYSIYTKEDEKIWVY